MTFIPLRCNICPKEPEFSDISHLLTHIASKGHLAQIFRAQVRARQDASVRTKLAAYDRWYDRYQIEKLLSERMIAKDSKDIKVCSSRASKTKAIPATVACTKYNKPRKRQPRELAESDNHASPVKVEGLLDPQLCHAEPASRPKSRQPSALAKLSLSEDQDSQRSFSEDLAVTPHQNLPSPFLSQPYQDYHHRAFVPRMSVWQSASSPRHEMTETTSTKSINNQPLSLGYDTDGESDYFQTFLRSPSRTAYPDPCEATLQRSDLMDGLSSCGIGRDPLMKMNIRKYNTKDSSVKDSASILQSPVLKGIKWPGMSLFDSASLDAQRLRNQKKDDSVLEQMEHNSATVEQMERIYWPDGSLKKQRLITGNVDSSPIKELTPPPKLSKRKRNKVEHPILTDLSTNAHVVDKRLRVRKATSPTTSTQALKLSAISTKALAELGPTQYTHPPYGHMDHDPHDDDDERERELTHGLPKVGRKKAFHIFNDQNEWGNAAQSRLPTKTNAVASSQSSHGHQGSAQSTGTGIALDRVQTLGPRLENATHGLPWDSTLRAANVKSRTHINDDSENRAPVLDGDGRIDDEAAPIHNGRVTQRYFSVTGDQLPQFFSSMPPGMDFGSMMEPRYHGSTLNPLNTYLRQPWFVHNHTRAVPSSRTAGLSTGPIGDQGPSDLPDPRRLGSRVASKRT